MEWSDAKMLQLIELYEKRPYLSHAYATRQRATGQSQRMQLYRTTLLHTRATKLREKIAGVTSVLGRIPTSSLRLHVIPIAVYPLP